MGRGQGVSYGNGQSSLSHIFGGDEAAAPPPRNSPSLVVLGLPVASAAGEPPHAHLPASAPRNAPTRPQPATTARPHRPAAALPRACARAPARRAAGAARRRRLPARPHHPATALPRAAPGARAALPRPAPPAA
ncbi:protein SPIRAL1-like 1, partial [Miscanthus floridulus]|uniref:protein SPIRAL1-like 1 n=1 Tax=Miscanthus floridulus TaxID=154761 RepID=UPI003457AE6F